MANKFVPLDIDDAFEDFMRQTFPSVPETAAQFRESRRIWYAGMWALLCHLKTLSAIPDDAAWIEIGHLEHQMKSFFKERVAGDKD